MVIGIIVATFFIGIALTDIRLSGLARILIPIFVAIVLIHVVRRRMQTLRKRAGIPKPKFLHFLQKNILHPLSTLFYEK